MNSEMDSRASGLSGEEAGGYSPFAPTTPSTPAPEAETVSAEILLLKTDAGDDVAAPVQADAAPTIDAIAPADGHDAAAAPVLIPETGVGDEYRDTVSDMSLPVGILAIGATATGTVNDATDVDLFQVTLVAGSNYVFEVRGGDSGEGTLGDPQLKLLDSTGAQIAQDDDSGTGRNSLIRFSTTTGGTYYLAAYGYNSQVGTYTVAASLGAAQADRVNTYITGDQVRPNIAVFSDGGYLIVWTSAGEDGDSNGVYAQRYNASGAKVHRDGTTAGADEFLVNTTTAGNQDNPQVAVLNGNKFVVVWGDYSGHDGDSDGVFAQLYAADGTTIGAQQQVNAVTSYLQDEQRVSATSDGGYIVSYSSYYGPTGDPDQYYGVYAQRFSGTGAILAFDGTAAAALSATRINTQTDGAQSASDVHKLSDGRLLFTYTGVDSNDRGIYGKIYNANGTVATDEFLVNNLQTGFQAWPNVVELTDHRIVVAWIDNTADGSGYGTYARIFSSTGVAQGDEFLVNTQTYAGQGYSSSDGRPSLVADADGGFAIAWHSDVDGNYGGAYIQRFDPEGDKIGGEEQVSPSYLGEQSAVVIAQTGAGLTAVWNSNDYGYTNTEDGSGFGIFTRQLALDKSLIAPRGGEDRVNTTTLGNQSQNHIAGAPDGSYVIVWRSDSGFHSGDGDRGGIFGQRYTAAGVKSGAEFQLNQTSTDEQQFPSVAWLDGANSGKFIATWSSNNQDGSSWGVYARVFNADGTPSGGEFLVNTTINSEQITSSVTALHGVNAGGYAIIFRGYGQPDGGNAYDVFKQQYDATGAKVGGETWVNNDHDTSYDYPAQVRGLADGGYVVVYSINDNGDTFAKHYDATGAVVEGFNPNGASVGLNSFQVNTYAADRQYSNNDGIVALADGGFFIVWQSNTQANAYSGYGVYGQFYSASGAPRGGEFKLNVADASDQGDPRAAVLADGSIVVVWESNQTDNGDGYDIYAKRIDASGNVLNEEFKVNTLDTYRDQDYASVAATADGFVVSWDDYPTASYYDTTGADGGSGAVFKKQFTIDSLNASAANANVAHRPTLSAADATVPEETSNPHVTVHGGALNIAAALGAGSLGTETLSLELLDLPVGVTVSDSHGHSFTASAQASAVDITTWTLSELRLTTPQLSTTGFTLTVRAESTDSNTHDTSTNLTTFDVAVADVAEPEPLNGARGRVNSNIVGNQNTADNWDQNYSVHNVATFSDGGYVIVWQDTSGLDGDRYGVFAQQFDAAGNPVGVQQQVNVNGVDQQYGPSVTVLSGDRWIVTWNSYNQATPDGGSGQSNNDIYSRIFTHAGVGGAETHVSDSPAYTNQERAVTTVLSDGGYLIAWRSSSDGSGYGVFAQRYNSAGQAVLRDGTGAGADIIPLNTTTANDQLDPSIVALPTSQGGGWVAVYSSYYDDSGAGFSQDIFYQRYNGAGQRVLRDGSALGNDEVHVNIAAVIDTQPGDYYEQRYPSTALVEGGYVVIFGSQQTDGSGYGEYGQIFNFDGSKRGTEFRVNDITGNDQIYGQVVSLSDGGFVVSFRGYDSNGLGIYGQRYDHNGNRVGDNFLLDAAHEYGDQDFPSIAVSGGKLVVTYTGGYNDGDGNGTAVFAHQLSIPFGDLVAASGDEQVNTRSLHDQGQPAITHLSNGGSVVVYYSNPTPGDTVNHDNSSNGVYAQLFAPDGTRLGTEFLVNTNTDRDQSSPAVTALDGGGFVVVWHSQTGSTVTNDYGIFGQKYDNTGAKVGGQFQIDTSGGNRAVFPHVAALHGASAGGFVVAWEHDYNADVNARVFNASGVAVGNDFRVNQQEPALNGNDGNELSASVSGTASGGFVVVWEDDDSDYNGSGIFGQRYAVDLGANTVTALTGINPDGSVAPDNFRVNTAFVNDQYTPKVSTLSDGSFIVVWTSNYADSSGAAIKAQFYNADGTLRGHEFQINSIEYDDQNQPDVTALDDGTFVVTWRSHDTGNYDIEAKRYTNAGAVVDEEFKVNTYRTGDQGVPVVSQTNGGFTVAWVSPGEDGDGQGVFLKRYLSDPGPNGGGVAGVPTLLVQPSAGPQDTAIALHVTAALDDPDPSTPETLTLSVSGLPIGATLSDGAGGHSFTAAAGTTTANISGWTLASLAVTPPTGSTTDFSLTVRALATETASHDIASSSVTLTVDVTPVLQPQPPFNAEYLVNQTTAGNQEQPKIASFADGSYVVTWTSDSQPGGYSNDVVARLFNADGTAKSAEFIVGNVNGNDNDSESSVTILKDGSFLVTWAAYDNSGFGIFEQRVSATGGFLNLDGTAAAALTPTLVTQGTDDNGKDAQYDTQQNSSTFALADGGWVTVWESYSKDGDGRAIEAKRFAADGTVVQLYDAAGTAADVVQINTVTVGEQVAPDVIQLADGRLVFHWQSPDTDGPGVFARIYNTDNHPAGAEFQVNSYTTSNQAEFYRGAGSSVPLKDGGYVITWNSYNQDGSDYGVYGQIYNVDGTVRGGELHISSYAYSAQQEPEVTALPDGGFLTTWCSYGQDGDSWGVFAQRFDARGDRVGEEFRLNTYIPGNESTPAVAVQGDGSGVVFVWESEQTAQDGYGNGVYGKRIPLTDAATEQPIERAGVEQQVNVTTNDQQLNSSLTKLTDGSFVVAWQSYNQDGSGWGVYARHYDAAGHALDWSGATGSPSELPINIYTNSDQVNVKIVALTDGTFAAIYQSYGEDGSGWGIYARHFAADGTALSLKDAAGTATTGDLLINHTINSDQVEVSTSLLSDGSLAVSWSSYAQDNGNSYGIFTNVLGVGTAPQLQNAADVQVNTHAFGDQQVSSVAGLAGSTDYIVVWQSNQDQDGSGLGVYGQILHKDGTPLGTEFLINSYSANDQGSPSVAGLTGGGFVVVWQSNGPDGSGYGIEGQLYDAVGHAVGGEFQLNGVAFQDQTDPHVVAAQDGGFLVSWTSNQSDGSSYAVVARRFDSAGHPTEPYGDDVVVNTYTLSDQSDSSITTLDRGFVVAWTSNGQDGSSYGVELQRFSGSGLQPPPLVVDKAHGADSNSDSIYTTIAEALAAAHDSDTIEIVGGADAAHPVVFNEAVDLTTKNNIEIRNRAGTFVQVHAPAAGDGHVLKIGSGISATIRGDSPDGLVFVGGTAGFMPAVELLGGNDGTVFTRTTLTAATGNEAVLIAGGQNGVLIQSSVINGGTFGAVEVQGQPTYPASTNVSFLNNTFNLQGGFGLLDESTGSQVRGNLFSGSAGSFALSLNAAGGDVQQNTFVSTGAPYILDVANAYSETTLINQNGLPNGWVYDEQGNGVYETLAQAFAIVQTGQRLVAYNRDFSGEAGLAVPVENIRLYLYSNATGVSLTLGAGVHTFELQGPAAADVTANNLGDTITGNDGANVLTGGTGADILNGGQGADHLNGGGGADSLNGGGGDDVVDGQGGDDSVFYQEGDGHDTVTDTGGTAGDKLTIDRYYYTNTPTTTVTGTAGGFNVAFAGDANSGLTTTGIEKLVFTTSTGNDGALSSTNDLTGVTSITYVGGAGAETVNFSTVQTATVSLSGGAGIDNLTGGQASDVLVGDAGADALDGQGGVDLVDYGAETGGGAVLVNLDSAAHVLGGVNIAAGHARDTFGDTDTLANIEAARGNSGADVFYGSSGANAWEGGAGNDTATGGLGSDSYIFQAGFGNDTITDFDVGANATDPDTDVLRFSPTVFATRAAVLAASAASGGNTVITQGANTVTLTGVTNLSIANIDIIGVNDGPTIRTNAPNHGLVEEGGYANATAGVATASAALKPGDVDGIVLYDATALTAAGWTHATATTWTLTGTYGGVVLHTDTNVLNYTLNDTDADTQALAGGASATDAFTVPVVDDGGLTASAVVTFAITGANDAPIATADAGSAIEAGGTANGTPGANATGNVLGNDTDVDTGDTKTVSALSGGTVGTALTGAHGSLTLAANGAYTYVVNNADTAVQALRTSANTITDTFTYTVRDTAGLTASATLTVTIQGADDAPVAVANIASATEAGGTANGTPGINPTGNLIADDTDVDSGDTKTLSAVGATAVASSGTTAIAGTHGSVAVAADGTYTYTVNQTDAAVQALRLSTDTITDTFTYTVKDTAGLTSSSTLTVTIHGADDAPVAVANIASATEAGGTANGAPGVNPTGNLITDDTDVDTGDAKTLSAVGATMVATSGTTTVAGAHGSVAVAADGSYTYSVNQTDAAVQALRLSTDTITDTFTYTVKDTAGLTSSSTLTVTIHGADDAPVALANIASATEAGGTANGNPGVNPTGNLIADDTDVDTGDAKTLSAIGAAAVASSGTTTATGSHGSLAVAADGSYTYTVNQSDAAVQALRLSTDTITDTFTYTVKDTAGLTSSSTLTVTIHGADDAPVAVANTASATEAGGTANGAPGVDPIGNLITDDTDVDTGDAKTLSAIGATAVASSGTTTATGTHGSLAVAADGSYTYTVNQADAVVQALRTAADTVTDSFTYTVKDIAGLTSSSTLTVTIHGADDAPVGMVDIASATEAGGTANGTPGIDPTGNVLSNDTDVDAGDSKAVSAVAFGATVGTVGTALAGAHGSLTLAASGVYAYAVNQSDAAVQALRTAADTLTETFSYTVRDTAGLFSISTLTVTIHGADDAPVAVANTASATEAGGTANGTVGVDPSGNLITDDTDVDTGDAKTLSAIGATAVASSGTTTATGTHGSLAVAADGSYTYTVNQTDAAVQALRTAADTVTDSFTYTVKDTAGLISSSTLTVTIHGADDAPTAAADAGSATEAGGVNNGTPGANATGNVLSNDTDVDTGDTKTVSALTGGAVGTPLTGAHGALTLAANGDYTYVVDNADAAVQALRTSGDTLTDTFTYTMKDTAGLTSSSTLTVTIHGADDAPVALADSGSAVAANPGAGTDAMGNVLTNDTDVDAGDSKAATAVKFGATNGTLGTALAGAYGSLTLNANGTYDYAVDNANAAVIALHGTANTLTEVYTYVMQDTAGQTSQANLTITIVGGTSGGTVTAVDDSAPVTQRLTGTGDLTGNDSSSFGGDTLTVTKVTYNGSDHTAGGSGIVVDGQYGRLTVQPDGTYAYYANTEALVIGQVVTDHFSYTVIDQHGDSGVANIDFTVTGSPDGDANANVLIGTAVKDTIHGNGGADQITGNGGGDQLYGGAGGDTFFYVGASDSLNGKNDDINDFEHGVDKVDISAVDGGYAEISFDNAGNSYLYFDSNGAGGGTQVIEFRGATPTFDDIVTSAAVTDRVYIGPTSGGPLNITGGSQAERFFAAAGGGTINGGGGKDGYILGAGVDTLVFSSAADSLNGAADVVYNFTHGQDLLDFSAAGGSEVDIGYDGAGKSYVFFGPGLAGQVIVNSLVSAGDLILPSGAVVVELGGATGAFLYGGGAPDTEVRMFAGSAGDYLVAGSGHEVMRGGAGADHFLFGSTADSAFSNPDIIYDFQHGSDKLDVSGADAGQVTLLLTDSTDTYVGFGGVFGAGGTSDVIVHGPIGTGDLVTSAGASLLTVVTGVGMTATGATADETFDIRAGGVTVSGGGGADTFIFSSLAGSPAANPSSITDFDPMGGDKIVLNRIDANTATPAHDAFHFVGAFDGQAGELTLAYDMGSNTTTLTGYVDTDATPDLVLHINGHLTDGSGFVL